MVIQLCKQALTSSLRGQKMCVDHLKWTPISKQQRALILRRNVGKASSVLLSKHVLSFSLCVSSRLSRPEQSSPEGHTTQTVCATSSKTWPTNLRIFPLPRMDKTSSHIGFYSAASSSKHQLFYLRHNDFPNSVTYSSSLSFDTC